MFSQACWCSGAAAASCVPCNFPPLTCLCAPLYGWIRLPPPRPHPPPLSGRARAHAHLPACCAGWGLGMRSCCRRAPTAAPGGRGGTDWTGLTSRPGCRSPDHGSSLQAQAHAYTRCRLGTGEGTGMRTGACITQPRATQRRATTHSTGQAGRYHPHGAAWCAACAASPSAFDPGASRPTSPAVAWCPFTTPIITPGICCGDRARGTANRSATLPWHPTRAHAVPMCRSSHPLRTWYAGRLPTLLQHPQ